MGCAGVSRSASRPDHECDRLSRRPRHRQWSDAPHPWEVGDGFAAHAPDRPSKHAHRRTHAHHARTPARALRCRCGVRSHLWEGRDFLRLSEARCMRGPGQRGIRSQRSPATLSPSLPPPNAPSSMPAAPMLPPSRSLPHARSAACFVRIAPYSRVSARTRAVRKLAEAAAVPKGWPGAGTGWEGLS